MAYFRKLIYFIIFFNLYIILIFSGKFTSFVVLCEKYEPCIKRDPSYSQYLEKISQIFFNVKPNRTNNNPSFIGKFTFCTI